MRLDRKAEGKWAIKSDWTIKWCVSLCFSKDTFIYPHLLLNTIHHSKKAKPISWFVFVMGFFLPAQLFQQSSRKALYSGKMGLLQTTKFFFNTGIPRLQRFLVTRFHFARIFEAEFLYYEMDIFLTIFFCYTMIHVARISRNAVFCLPQKTR